MNLKKLALVAALPLALGLFACEKKAEETAPASEAPATDSMSAPAPEAAPAAPAEPAPAAPMEPAPAEPAPAPAPDGAH